MVSNELSKQVIGYLNNILAHILIIPNLLSKPCLILKRVNLFREEKLLSRIYKRYIKNNDRVDCILRMKIDNLAKDLIAERDLPGNEKYLENGWWKQMLLRYALAMHFCKGRHVLETCSGLGWGAYLLDGVAKSLLCIEIDEQSINLSKRLWSTNKTKYINGSVLKIPVEDNKYDVVTAMESIEHFKLEDIKIYLSETYRILRPGGFLIGSSIFPDTRKEADALCSNNKYHLHIYTKREIEELLREQGFRKIKIFHNRLFFIAKK